MRNHFALHIFLGILFFSTCAFAQEMKILVNQVGYEPDGPKCAVILGHQDDAATVLKVVDTSTEKEVITIVPTKVGPVDQWKDWYFWSADFSKLDKEGTYRLECATSKGPVRSWPFLVQHDLLERNTLSNVIYYFKSQRCSGLLDKADRNLPFEDGKSGATADLHGGWYDASGDTGKHLSHLSFSIYFNPQQIPFTDWTLFKTYELLKARDTSPDKNFRQYKRRLMDEALFGADYLVRSKTPNGSFYRSVDGPGARRARRIGACQKR